MKKLNAEYLGTYIVDYVDEKEILVEENEKSLESYDMDEFMYTGKNSMFDGMAGETNCSSVALKFIDSDTVKLWRVWWCLSY